MYGMSKQQSHIFSHRVVGTREYSLLAHITQVSISKNYRICEGCNSNCHVLGRNSFEYHLRSATNTKVPWSLLYLASVLKAFRLSWAKEFREFLKQKKKQKSADWKDGEHRKTSKLRFSKNIWLTKNGQISPGRSVSSPAESFRHNPKLNL